MAALDKPLEAPAGHRSRDAQVAGKLVSRRRHAPSPDEDERGAKVRIP